MRGPDARSSSGALLWVALAVGVTSLSMNVYVLTRAPAKVVPLSAAAFEPAPAAATSAGWNNALLVQTMAELTRRVDALEAQAQRSPAQARDAGPGSGPAPYDSEVPRYVRFDLPSNAQGLALKQDERGGLHVTNTDPALTGKVLMIKGETEDGATKLLSILVPAPAGSPTP